MHKEKEEEEEEERKEIAKYNTHLIYKKKKPHKGTQN